MTDRLIRAHVRVTRAVAERYRRAVAEPVRGDVPGWVLITLMTAALVIALWTIAGTRLTAMFEDALDSVTSGVGGK